MHHNINISFFWCEILLSTTRWYSTISVSSSHVLLWYNPHRSNPVEVQQRYAHGGSRNCRLCGHICVHRVAADSCHDLDRCDNALLWVICHFFWYYLHMLEILLLVRYFTPFDTKSKSSHWIHLLAVAVTLPFLAFFYISAMNYFRRVSRETKRLESIARSPVYSQFSETLGGKTVVWVALHVISLVY